MLKDCLCTNKFKKPFKDSTYVSLNIDEGKYTSLDLCRRLDTGDWYLRAIGEDEAYDYISYCPFCGRKLDKSEKFEF